MEKHDDENSLTILVTDCRTSKSTKPSKSKDIIQFFGNRLCKKSKNSTIYNSEDDSGNTSTDSSYSPSSTSSSSSASSSSSSSSSSSTGHLNHHHHHHRHHNNHHKSNLHHTEMHSSSFELSYGSSDTSSLTDYGEIRSVSNTQLYVKNSLSSVRKVLNTLTISPRSLSCGNSPAKDTKQKKLKKQPQRILRQPVVYTYVKGLSGLPTQRVPRTAVCCRCVNR